MMQEGNKAVQNISDDNIPEENILKENILKENIPEESITEDIITEDNILEESITEDIISEENLSEGNLSEDNLSEDNPSEDNLSEGNLSGNNLLEENHTEDSFPEETTAEGGIPDDRNNEGADSEDKPFGAAGPSIKKAGFATIIGRPNVGKSTLMNRMIGQKIAITSYKPQTTRNRIRTIYTGAEGQIVFLDTPGIHESRTKLGTYMVKAAKGALKEVDVILWLVEPRQKLSAEDESIIALLSEIRTPVIVVINKIDKVKKAEILPVIDLYAHAGSFSQIIPVSARTGSGVDHLMEEIFRILPVGEPFYDEDMVTTQTEREITGEIVREKALRLLQEEVPHGIAVTIESMKTRSRKRKTDICDIEASIICEKESHKRIVIGKGGEMLRRIGMDARKDIENLLQCQVNLRLWVKVRRDWKDDETQIRSFGYDERKL